jgi:hypothetical protein
VKFAVNFSLKIKHWKNIWRITVLMALGNVEYAINNADLEVA